MNHQTVPSLGGLADPSKYHNPISLGGLDVATLVDSLRSMKLIRCVERQLARGREIGSIGGPVHLGVGQEAIAVGVSHHLGSTDRVFGAHRSHSHLLALSPDPYRLFAEVLGKDTGFSKGMGGSMHLWDQNSGFYGSVPIVAGTVSLAVGAAMAARMQKTKDVAVVYFGDGAVEEGVVHESFNLARIRSEPILFVVENNLFASHMHISLRQPSDVVSRFAAANDIAHDLVDGNDVVAVSSIAGQMIDSARNGKGPGLLEVVTYRWYGHVDWREDLDVGVHRSQDELENWRARDPILRLSTAMIAANLWDADRDSELDAKLDSQIAKAWEKALNDPYPESSATMDRVFSKGAE